jgi:3-oxoacyl-[acyl-carrier protein] reductase
VESLNGEITPDLGWESDWVLTVCYETHCSLSSRKLQRDDRHLELCSCGGEPMDLGLTGRTAIVTGSSRGIGRATAQLLAAEGARVAVTYRRDRLRAEAVVESIRKHGGDGLAVFFDLASPDSIREATNAVVQRWGRIDVLVNSASQWVQPERERAAGDADRADDRWRESLRTNLEGVYCAIRAVVPLMRAKHWGRIVNVSSVAAVDGMVGFAWYAASKAALRGLARTLARELGDSGVLVNNVMPGGTMTSTVFNNLPSGVLMQKARELPTGRLPLAEEVAAVIVFLVSTMNTTVTGEDIRVSGGRR